MNNEQDAGDISDQHQHAPWLPIPSRAISVVEHPCIVKNVDKGIASLGGPVKLSKGLPSTLETPTDGENDNKSKQLLSVSLRPDDPFAKRLLSQAVTTNNLLLKVTVPKRTGRKRKRGTTGPFVSEEEAEAGSNGHANGTSTHANKTFVDASTIYRSLQDNASTYKIQVAGMVDEIHRFRTMPDLQYSATHNDTMVKLRDHILPVKYSELQNYELNTAAGADLTRSVGPSAEFMQMPVNFNYRMQQNTYVKYTEKGVVNLRGSLAYNSYTIIKPTDENIPIGPKPNLPPESTLTPYVQTLIAEIRAELKKRPVITRHLLYNKLGWNRRTRLRQAAVYCGFFFESGPWREALVAWGVDPRKDPSYRKYQTVSFTSYSKPGRSRHGKAFDEHVAKLSQMSGKELETEHIFDGKTVSDTGSRFQFCDLTDPILANILATDDIRPSCAHTFQGWYHVGTWAKVTVILKDKMNTILAGQQPDDALYQRVISWPELWEDQEIAATYKAEVDNRQIHEEKKREHEVMHNVRYAARNPRYAFEKMEGSTEEPRQSTEEDGDAEDAEIPEDMTEIPDTAATIINEGEKEVEDQDAEDYDEDEDNDDDDNERIEDEARDEDAEYDEDDEDDVPLVSMRAVSAGPAPFGGLYRA